MSYGSTSTTRPLLPTNEKEAQSLIAESNSQKPLIIFGVILAVTLLGCVAAIIILVPNPGDNHNAILLGGAGSTTSPPRGFRLGNRNNTQQVPTISMSLGRLKGVVLKSRAGRDYYGFYNVPYGQPPIGKLRFMPPEPAESWRGTRDATVKGSKCIQRAKTNMNNTEGAEDCLHINLYTPKIPSQFRSRNSNAQDLPVIVYFFGGGFMHGTANDFSAEYFMDEEIIIVIVECRVGAMGFLSTGDLVISGNQGLKDQNLALKWVQQNINDFGGDPKRVVAFGTSSGAMCAHAHLLSPMSEGLFTGVMSFSGTMLSRSSIQSNPRKNAEMLGEALGCPDLKNSTALLHCLQNATTHEIAQNQPDFAPSVEAVPSDGKLSSVFLHDSPINLLKSGNVNKIPWITGVNSAEAILQSYTLLLNPAQLSNMNAEMDDSIRMMLGLGNDSESVEISQKLHNFYFGNKSVDVETRYNLTNLMSDASFIFPAKSSAALQAEQSPVYTYYLTKEANVSWAKDVTKYFDPPHGVSHADEVQYFFLRPGYPYIPLDSEWGNFSVMVVKLWVSFAETGAPVGPIDWPSVPKNWTGLTWYNLDDEVKMVEPITERMELWNSFPLDKMFPQPYTLYEDETRA